MTNRTLRVGIFGAPLDTGNLGVSALGLATIEGLARFAPRRLECLLFDHGKGTRALDCGVPIRVDRVGAYYSRRVYRPESLLAAALLARRGVRSVHPLIRQLRQLDAVLDISGGDSFTDLYGTWRFHAVTAPKCLALDLDVPLVLLPQTYGPFASAESRARARELLLGARRVWARDAHSLAIVRDLLGPDFDERLHRDGVDVAFGLPPRAPAGADELVRSLRRKTNLLLGLNVSGLLFHREGEAKEQYGLAVPYRAIVTTLLGVLLDQPGSRVVLVPHVVSPCTAEEDDVSACHALRGRLPEDLRNRVVVAPALSDPREAKWVIGNCDWFCGTRMHACIAALSQGIPSLGIAYSDKTAGVFETVAMSDQVVDARNIELAALTRSASSSLAARDETAKRLTRSLPPVLSRWEAQFRTLLSELCT